MIAQIFKSKTMVFSILLAMAGAFQATMGVFSPYMTPEAYGLFTVAVAGVVAILRILTTMPLEDK